jgi:excisionase family DNA binding protein
MLTSHDLQDLLHVDRSTIYRMAESGRLPAMKVGRQWRFPEEAIRRWLAGDTETTPSIPNGRGDLPPSLKPALDVIAEMLGVMLVVSDMDGVPLADASNSCGLFDVVAAMPGGVDECIAGWQELAGGSDIDPRFTESHLGLECARAFVRNGAELTAMVIAGGIAPEWWPPSDEELATMASSFGASGSDLSPHLDEVHTLDDEGRQRVIDMLPRVASMIPEMTAEYRSMKGRLDAIAALSKELNA